MKNKTKIGIAIFLLLLVFILLPGDAQAQCPMCRMSAESNLKAGGTDGRGLNTGILYMLAMPYMLVAAIGFWWWRNRKPGDKRMLDTGAEDLGRLN
ncbi:MAG: hypothetical protein IPH12_09805 [Saprospirales bacterium]|nr:hypothetical protein [Saprospirales bacterium]MBK8921343.1 hypothetical protein [Saprospirales bacterium]